MKIFNSAQIHELDQYTIEHEPVKSIDLMERAAHAFTDAFTATHPQSTPVVVFAGPGNNGGDALAVARLLGADGYHVSVYLFNIHNKLSADCEQNKQLLVKTGNIESFIEVTCDFDPPQLTADMVVIDGLFGTGINKPLTGGFASLVRYINQSDASVVSIDMPSGLMCEDNTANVKANIIKATDTYTFQQPKLALLLPDSNEFTGRVHVLDIRLSEEYINQTPTQFSIAEEGHLSSLLKPRPMFAHKGTMGHALIIAGSYGMGGAAVLAVKACLRSGAGKVTAFAPKKNDVIMQISVPEAVLSIGHDSDYFSTPISTDNIDALGIGPGLGQQEDTAIAMISQIRGAQCPVVIDADALNMLSNHRSWIQQLPEGSILTPHPREFDRLWGTVSTSCYERLTHAVEMAQNHNCYIVLKGHFSALCTPTGKVYFNRTGNAGMATAGAGDVLTGIITALVARGYNQQNACLLGMYLHGLAGDLAAKQLGMESLMASDIINYLPQAFKRLED